MPTLTLLSLYNARKSMYAAHLARARAELERFKEDLVARFGQETADAVKHADEVDGGHDLRADGSPPPHRRGLRRRQDASGDHRERQCGREEDPHADCWFREAVEPISVLETVGSSWKEVEERFVADERLSLPGVLWLLHVLRTTPQVMPSDEQVYEWAARVFPPVICLTSGGRCFGSGSGGWSCCCGRLWRWKRT